MTRLGATRGSFLFWTDFIVVVAFRVWAVCVWLYVEIEESDGGCGYACRGTVGAGGVYGSLFLRG